MFFRRLAYSGALSLLIPSAERMTLSGEEFIRRFLLHVLPPGLMRIRHYGFLANRCREAKLKVIRAELQSLKTAGTDPGIK